MKESLIDVDLIDLSLDVSDKENLFREVADSLRKKNYVYAEYANALNKREKEFPTGLATMSLNIALPHTDTEFIQKPFVFIARSKKAVEFLQMGDNQPLDCKHFLFLGIKDPKKQVGLLAALIELFGNERFVSDFKSVDTSLDMYNLLKEKI